MMFRLVSVAVAMTIELIGIHGSPTAEGQFPVPSNLIALDTPGGELLLARCHYRDDFLRLMLYFETQQNLGYCGPATTAMVLNAMGVERPASSSLGPFHFFTQENVFCDQARAVKAPELVSREGLSLDQLGPFLEAQGIGTETTFASETTLEAFRDVVRSVLRDRDRFLIANYLRKEIGQESGGHISPIAAYDEDSDRLLILDVSRYKYPPVWAKLDEFWRAMATVEPDSGRSRGFVIVMRRVEPPRP